MLNLLENVELSWAFLDPTKPQESYGKKQWSIAANISKDKAKEFKKAGYIRTLNAVEDADGNETGEYKVTFRQNAVSAAGKEMHPPKVFTKDAGGTIRPLTGAIIGNGSIGSVSFERMY